MGEGTRTVDVGAEIAELRKRIEALEARPIYNPYWNGPAPSPISPAPMPVAPMGCVCPIGAEFNCQSSGCPRRGPFRITATM